VNALAAVDFSFLDRPGGSGRVAWDLAEVLRERGHSVTMISAYPPGPENRESALTSEHGFRLLRYAIPELPVWHPGRAKRMSHAAAEALRRHLPGERWDLVHIHTPGTGEGAHNAVGRGPRYVYTVHSPVTMEQEILWRAQGGLGRLKLMFGLGTLRAVERTLIDASHAVHVLSQFTKTQLQREHGVGDRVTVIPHWSRTDLKRSLSRQEARRKLGWPLDRPVLFTVRGHVPRTGIDVAIRAIAPLTREKDFLFVVAGDGPLRPTFMKLAESLSPRAGSLQFPGRISEDVLALSYQAADLFVLPTLALECFGLITVEAMSFGCPVIGTDAGATPELLEPLDPRLVVPAGNVAALSEKVRQFLSGELTPPDEATIRAYVDRNYSRAVIVPRFLELFSDNGLTA
jgi:glycosyltransferase involved in cell wall biosynthesis